MSAGDFVGPFGEELSVALAALEGRIDAGASPAAWARGVGIDSSSDFKANLKTVAAGFADFGLEIAVAGAFMLGAEWARRYVPEHRIERGKA